MRDVSWFESGKNLVLLAGQAYVHRNRDFDTGCLLSGGGMRILWNADLEER